MARALVLSLALTLSLLASPGTASPIPREVAAHAADRCRQHLPLDRAAFDASPLPVGALVPCPGIRPGARVWIENADSTLSSGCTLNFVFRGTRMGADGVPIDEGLFVGTAGHCVPDHDGERTWAPGQGPVAKDASNERFGEVAYAVLRYPRPAGPDTEDLDFALIRVDDARESEVKPGLCHFGGPTGLSRTWDEGNVVHHFGQGSYYEKTVQGRSGVVAGDQGTASAITFYGSVTHGDSGSPLIEADGDALGVVVAMLLGTTGGPLVLSTPIGVQMDRARANFGVQLELVQAPLA